MVTVREMLWTGKLLQVGVYFLVISLISWKNKTRILLLGSLLKLTIKPWHYQPVRLFSSACLCRLLKYMGCDYTESYAYVHYDNKSAIQVAKNEVFHNQKKSHWSWPSRFHYHFKEMDMSSLPYIWSCNHLANLFSKSHFNSFCLLKQILNVQAIVSLRELLDVIK